MILDWRRSMQNSKWISVLLTSSIALSFLAGCSIPPSKDTKDNKESSSFVVKSLDGEVTETKVIQGFSVPASKTIAFTACVLDLKQARPILNHKFKIIGGKAAQDIVTDGSGCLHWSEEIAYNHFGEAKFVSFDRGLVAEGLQKGERVLHLAVNPWENKIFDLEKKTVENLVAADRVELALNGQDLENSKSLMINELQAFILEKDLSNAGTNYRLELRGQPNLQFKKSSKEEIFEPLVSGKFLVRLRLGVSETEKSIEKITLIASSEWIAVDSVRGQIAIPFDFKMTQSCGRGNFVLGVEIKPSLPEKYKMTTSEALYLLSSCDGFSGRISAVLSSQSTTTSGASNFSLNDYFMNSNSAIVATTEPTSPVKPGPESQVINNFQKSGLFLKNFQTVVVDFIGTGAFDRKATLEITACLATTGGKEFKAQSLMVTKMNGTELQMMTLPDGCLRWDDSLTFKIQDQECEQASQIVISHQNLNVKMEIPILVNPWAKTVRNGYANPDVKNRAPHCAEGKSYLLATQFEFKNSKYSADIDPYLNLKVRRTGTFQMAMGLNRPSLTTEDSKARLDAPNGDYLLTLAVLHEDADILNPKASEVLMVQEQKVQIQGLGTISEELTLETENLKEIGSASQVVILVKPFNESKNFEAKLLKGIFVNSNVFETSPLTVVKEANSLNLDNLFATYARLKKDDTQAKLDLAFKLSSKTQLQSEMNLNLINLNDEASSLQFRSLMTNMFQTLEPEVAKSFVRPPLDSAQLKQWLKSETIPPEMAKLLCNYWLYNFLQKPESKDQRLRSFLTVPYLNVLSFKCTNAVKESAAGFFDIQVRSFVKNPVKLSEESSASDYTISQAFNVGRSYVESESSTKAWDWNAGLSLKFLEVLSIGGGYRHQIANTKQTAQQEASTNTFVNQVSTTIENVAIKFRAEKSEKCMIIKVRPEIWSKDDAEFAFVLNSRQTKEEKILAARSGLMICEGQWSDQPQEFTENYWIMNQNMHGSQATSPQSAKTRKFVAVRGDVDFMSFMSKTTEGYAMPESFKSQFIGKTFMNERLKSLYMKNMPGSPGQIIHTEKSAH